MTTIPTLSPAWQAIAPGLAALGHATITKAIADDGKAVLPSAGLIYRAFDMVPPDRCSTVILGQDPYPTRGHAMGLAFSVPNGQPLARTFKNIAKEYQDDLGYPLETSDLSPWAERGVLLANVALTVKEGQPKSHFKLWARFAEAWISALASHGKPKVWVLWGNDAQDFLPFILSGSVEQRIIASSHPSPLAARHSFIGSKPFSEVNRELTLLGETPINWKLDLQPTLF